ncbi:MAG: hypothetical protein M1368_09330 [Thaumarchaeota archaeon]|nr:hypothetical protein [Nitrososphaerota archaeon]
MPSFQEKINVFNQAQQGRFWCLSMKGYNYGLASFGLAIFFVIIFVLTFLYPGTPTLSYSAVALGIGTVVSVIVIAAALTSG